MNLSRFASTFFRVSSIRFSVSTMICRDVDESDCQLIIFSIFKSTIFCCRKVFFFSINSSAYLIFSETIDVDEIELSLLLLKFDSLSLYSVWMFSFESISWILFEILISRFSLFITARRVRLSVIVYESFIFLQRVRTIKCKICVKSRCKLSDKSTRYINRLCEPWNVTGLMIKQWNELLSEWKMISFYLSNYLLMWLHLSILKDFISLIETRNSHFRFRIFVSQQLLAWQKILRFEEFFKRFWCQQFFCWYSWNLS